MRSARYELMRRCKVLCVLIVRASSLSFMAMCRIVELPLCINKLCPRTVWFLGLFHRWRRLFRRWPGRSRFLYFLRDLTKGLLDDGDLLLPGRSVLGPRWSASLFRLCRKLGWVLLGLNRRLHGLRIVLNCLRVLCPFLP